MRALITYDVAVPDAHGRRRLRRVAKLMERYGVRVQKSVFECLLDARRLEKLRLELEDLIQHSQDSILIYRLGECCAHRTLRLGVAPDDRLVPETFVL